MNTLLAACVLIQCLVQVIQHRRECCDTRTGNLGSKQLLHDSVSLCPTYRVTVSPEVMEETIKHVSSTHKMEKGGMMQMKMDEDKSQTAQMPINCTRFYECTDQ